MRADPSAIGARIKQLRLARSPRLTQEQLAERAGVSVDLISKLEQGQRQTARLASLHKLASALGVEVSLLLARPSPVAPSDEPITSPAAKPGHMGSPAASPVRRATRERPALDRLTQEMRRRRRAASLSQRALSQRMAYVREYVTLAERGVRVPSREFVVRYAQALGATQVLQPLWEAARAEDEAIKRARQPQEARPGPGLDQAAAWPINTAAGLVRDAADAAVAASRKRSNADPMTLDELDQDVERFTRECPCIPHAELFPQVWDDWRRVEKMLDGRQSLKDRAHLTLLGGEFTYFLARLSFNMGAYGAARRHAVLAWHYADDVGQPVLCASVRTLQGTIAFYASQHQKALEFLQAAEPYQTRYSRPRIAANRARAYSVLGEGSKARHALAEMEQVLVDVRPQPGDAPYTTATALSALASTLTRLGDGTAAEEHARQAVALHDLPGAEGTLFEDRDNATLNLAASLVVRSRPEPEEAARLGIQTIAIPQGQRTETVRKRAAELLWLLDGWRATAAVKDFAERLHHYELPMPTT
jgi:transcriptional regulator with XRE-family HTH domain